MIPDTKIDQMTAILPAQIPADHSIRLFLYVARRMGGHGLNDAHAVNALLGTFGLSYRRPLVLTRALMLELARASHRKIVIAGCCCGRMTADEALLVTAVTQCQSDVLVSRDLLTALLGSSESVGVITTAQALHQAYLDLGHPFSLSG